MENFMSTRYQITCINKTDRTSAHERIRKVGGVASGTRWTLTQEEVITSIEQGKYSFFVNRGGHEANVLVATSRYGNKYIKTVADGEQPDNLLSLPECP
jgi:hypothetical protein